MKRSPLQDRDRARRRALILIWLFPVLILALLFYALAALTFPGDARAAQVRA